jgi:hypothetical protein
VVDNAGVMVGDGVCVCEHVSEGVCDGVNVNVMVGDGDNEVVHDGDTVADPVHVFVMLSEVVGVGEMVTVLVVLWD